MKIMNTRRLAWTSWLIIVLAGTTSAQDPTEELYWESVDCEVEEQVSQYLMDYPQGAYVDVARECLEAIQAKEGGDDGDGTAAGIAERLAQCSAHLEARRLISGEGGTAVECYRAVLERDPGNAEALAGLEEIEDTYAEWARVAIEAGDVARAKANLEKLKILNPYHRAVSAVADAVSTLREKEKQRRPRPHEKVRVAIMPFGWQSDNGLPPERVGSIIQADLARSGRFQLVPKKDFVGQPHDHSEVQFEKWRSLNAEALVIGRILPLQSDRFQVEFRLFDVSGERQLGGFRYDVHTKNLRKIGHQIADYVYEALLDSPGAFDTRIAYVAKVFDGSQEIHMLQVADSDGQNPRIVLKSGRPIFLPDWSPDGEQLSYVSLESSRYEIYVHELSTAERKLVASANVVNSRPAWSPDNEELLIALNREGNSDIYRYDIRSEELTKLTESSANDRDPDWSPDGRSIVFTSDRSGSMQIYRMNVDGSDVEVLTEQGSSNWGPSFSLGGDEIVYMTKRGKEYSLVLLDLDGNLVYTLTKGFGDSWPVFSPNGANILFVSSTDGSQNVEMVSTDGRTRYRLIEGPVLAGVAWSPFNQ